jgi:hypothetical protein
MKALKAYVLGRIVGLFRPSSVQDIFKDFQKKAEALDKLTQRKLMEADARMLEQAAARQEADTAYTEAEKARETAGLIRSLFPVS